MSMITLRFIRSGTGAANDDKIIITMKGVDNYNLSFTYGDVKVKKDISATLSGNDVFRWMRSAIGLLELDTDPFKSIQVDFPLMPSVLIDAKNIDAAYNKLLNALEFHLDNWPKAPTCPTCPNPQEIETDDVFESEAEAELESESESESEPVMPELIRMPSFVRHHIFCDDDEY